MEKVLYEGIGNKGFSMARLNPAVVCRLYLEAGLNTTEIASTLGCTQPAVLYHLRQCKVNTRSTHESYLLKRSRNEEAVSSLVSSIIEGSRDGVGTQAPAANDEESFFQQCQPQEQTAQTPSFVLPPNSKKPYGVNEDFFKTFRPDMLWVLGLLYTDGCMSKTGGQFTLSSVDIDMLEQVRELMQFEGPLRSVGSHTTAKALTVCRRSMYLDLSHLGLHPAKTFTVQWPKMPPYMTRHFVRGCWDGDGCFGLTKATGQVSASFRSASKQFAQAMYEELSKLHAFSSGQYKLTMAASKPGMRIINGKESYCKGDWVISFGGHPALEEFYWYLYESVPENQRMKRKHDRLRDFLDRKGRMQLAAVPDYQALAA